MFASVFADLKMLIGATLHLSPDALHVHVGLILFLTGAFLMRTQRRFLYSLGWLFGLCMVGEWMDLAHDLGHHHQLRWLNGVKDIVNTAFWPAIWVIASPLAERLRRPSLASIAEEPQGSGK